MATQAVVLQTLGFRSVRAFQQAWNLGAPLAVDGVYGPLTTAAGNISLNRHIQGLGDISAHFSAREFACKCGGTLPGCQLTLTLRPLLESLEQLRTRTGPLSIVSGYRCPTHNKDVGGEPNSQHLYGAAADIPELLTFDQVRPLGLFAGIGYMASDRKVVHVDRRDRSLQNPTRSTVSNPAVWTY